VNCQGKPSPPGGEPPGLAHPDGPTLGAYFDGALGTSAARRVSSHVAGCAPCAAHLADLEALALALADTEEAPAPARLFPGVMAALASAPRPEQVARLALAQLLGAGAVAVATLPTIAHVIAATPWRQTAGPAARDLVARISGWAAGGVSALHALALGLRTAAAAAQATVPGAGGSAGGPWSHLAVSLDPMSWIGLLLAATVLWIVVHGAVPFPPALSGAPNGDRR